MSLTTWVMGIRTKALCWSCLGLSVLLCPYAHSEPAPLELFMPNAPPLTLEHDPQGHGMVGEVVMQAIARAGYVAHVNVLPWARAQKRVNQKQDLLITPLSRTPEREDQYTWIAAIMPMGRAFFSLEKRVTSFAEARQAYRLVGVGLGSAQEEILRTQGFSQEQIYPLNIGDNPAQLLLKGRIDAWFNGVPESRYIWRGVSQRPLLMSPVMSQADLYLACSKQCAPQVVKDLREAVETLRRDGTLTRIQQAYGGSP